jgi:hypothetical protein
MPNLTIRNVTKDVHKLLVDSAKVHNRSLNQEIISILSFEAHLAQRGLELVRTFPAPRRPIRSHGTRRLKGSRQKILPGRKGI